MQGEEQVNQIGAVIRVEVSQEYEVDIVHAPVGLAGFNQPYQGPGPGVQQDGLAVHGHPVGSRIVSGSGHGSAGAQNVESDHGYKGNHPGGGVKDWRGLLRGRVGAPGGPFLVYYPR